MGQQDRTAAAQRCTSPVRLSRPSPAGAVVGRLRRQAATQKDRRLGRSVVRDPGSADPGTRGTGQREIADERERWLQDAGQVAIAHHFACSRSGPLRHALVDDGVAYLCDECGSRVTVGSDWQAVQPEPEPGALAAPAVPRRPGRRPWTPELFRQRWAEALERGQLPASATYPEVARYFEALDGTVGEIDPDYLGRLARRYRASQESG